jgi:competence transcription factor ComK
MILARIRQSSHFSLHAFLFPSHSKQQTDPIRIGHQNLQNRKNLLLVKNNLENNTQWALMSVTSFLPLVVWPTFFSSLQGTYQILNNSFLEKP